MTKKTPPDPAKEEKKTSLTLVRAEQAPARSRLTARQEQFSVDVAAGMRPEDAYLKSYNWSGTQKAVSTEAAKLQRHAGVAARIAELRNQYATKVVEASRGMPTAEPAAAYGVKEAVDEIDSLIAAAYTSRQFSVAAKCIELKMKLHGLGISDAKNPKDKDELPPEELEAALEQLREMREKKHG